MNLRKQIGSRIIVASLIAGTMLSSQSIISNADSTKDLSALQQENTNFEVVPKNEMRSYLSENGVTEEQQDVLIDKLEKGIPWDCDIPQKVKSIPEDYLYLDLENNETEKTYRFKDGSFISIAFEPVDDIPGIDSRVIESGSFGTNYINHRVRRTVGNCSASYIVSAWNARTPSTSYGWSRIYTSANSGGVYNDPYGESCQGFGYAGDESLKVVREQENTYNAALVDYKWTTSVNVSAGWNGNGISISSGGSVHLYTSLKGGKMYVSGYLPF